MGENSNEAIYFAQDEDATEAVNVLIDYGSEYLMNWLDSAGLLNN